MAEVGYAPRAQRHGTTPMKLARRILVIGLILDVLVVLAGGVWCMAEGIGGKSEGYAGLRESQLVPVMIGSRYGYVDRKGVMRIGPRFEYAICFCEGLAGVKVDGKGGFIDETGRMVLPARYDDVGIFIDGHAEVTLNGRPAVIDKRGRRVRLTQYQKTRRDLKLRGLWGPTCLMCWTGAVGAVQIGVLVGMGLAFPSGRGKSGGDTPATHERQ